MITTRRLHLEIPRRGKKAYGVIRSSFRPHAIQQSLAQKHLRNAPAPAVLYDITRSHMEGACNGT